MISLISIQHVCKSTDTVHAMLSLRSPCAINRYTLGYRFNYLFICFVVGSKHAVCNMYSHVVAAIRFSFIDLNIGIVTCTDTMRTDSKHKGYKRAQMEKSTDQSYLNESADRDICCLDSTRFTLHLYTFLIWVVKN